MKRSTKYIATATIAALLLQSSGMTPWTAVHYKAEAASAGPVVVSTYPANGAVSIPSNTSLKLTFDEPVNKGAESAYIHVRRVDTNEEVQTISAASAAVSMSAGGLLATISLQNALTAGAAYYVRIDQGAFVNVSNGANFAGINDATNWRFSVEGADTTPPSITATSPAVNEANVPIGALRIEFNENVYASSGYITITRTGGDTQSIDVGSALVKGSGTGVITIFPDTPLLANSEYTVNVPAGAFKDGAGNSHAGISGWKFTTAAANLAVVMAPESRSMGASRTGDLTLTVTNAASVAKSTVGKITIKRVGDNSQFQQLDVTAAEVSVTGNVITIKHNEFEVNQSYYVLIDPGTFTADGQVYQGITDASTWTFSTASGIDTAVPKLLSLSPAPNGTASIATASLYLTFDEPVYPSSGSIVIMNAANDSIFQTIPITSPNIKGGGTNTITIDHNAFITNSSYYVQVSQQAFRDLAGNYYGGILNKDWSFRVTTDTTAPLISSLSPASGVNNASVNSQVSITFNEPVQVRQSTGSAVFRRTGSSSGAINATLSVDPADNRRVILTPKSALAASANYYVEISNTAIADLAGNAFAGIQNASQWTFSTIGTDRTAPNLTGAAMSGSSTIVLTYNEALDPSSVPSAGSFYVTVNGEARQVTSVTISDKTVSLTLSKGVIFGQTVTVSYTKGLSPIQDASGNAASSLTNRTVTNTLDTTLPKPTSGTINGNIIVVLTNQSLGLIDPNTISQFTVKINGIITPILGVNGAGNMIVLTLGTNITTGVPVSVSYVQGSNPIVDVNGNALQSFTDYYVRNVADNIAPKLQSTTVSGNTITLTYDEGLDSTNAPGKASYSVVQNGTSKTINTVEVKNNQVILTLSSSISTSAGPVLVTYVPGENALRDLAGNLAVMFSGIQAVAGTSGATVGQPTATVDKATLTLTFSEALNTSYVPKVNQFTVKTNGLTSPVANVTLNGSTAVLTLYTAVPAGSTVTVSYAAESGGLRNQKGTLISSFSNITAVNSTQGESGGVSGSFEATPDGAIVLQPSHYTVASSLSPGKQTANLYTVKEESLNNGFDAARSISKNSPKVMLTIPSTEKAGLASIPLQALENAKNAGGDPVFVIQYGDVTYEIPCSALDYAQIIRTLNVGGTTGYLIVKIDKTTNLTYSLTSALNKAGTVAFINPIHFETSVMVAGTEKEMPPYNKHVTISINTPSTMLAEQTAVVTFDSETNALSYVPTKVAASGTSGSKISFMRKNNGDFAVVKGNVSYSDISSHWARKSIQLLANKYIVEGRTTTKYEPNKPITRGEFAMFIARGLGLSGDKAAAGAYTDLNKNTALAAYIGAASKAGIVTGNSDGTFKPNSFITRQEAAAMLNRAAVYAGVNITLPQSADSYLNRFVDRAKIGTWAKQDVAKSVSTGFMTGVTAKTFVPLANTTRAEAAIMIQRLLTYVGFLQA
ncbi:Ig-like domain-containing protein [Paenibacillus xylaniclasticus]|uniref:Ig-like domain-containing protein n=1 Tax=Paenibacillus xylaniclasticus TaxID=588083 RepID=UPI000FD7F5B1|nr:MULTISPECIES: Ig-like domain-containing protein [Paenibacillus]GFN32668.1 hypothetical protein PCURB6_29280 [Paenibacillus curdlanolyticus]